MRTPETGVVASSAMLAANGMSYTSVISLALGLIGVVLARMVFVDRQNRKLGRRQTWRETVPLTGVAMLIAGTVIWDKQLGVSLAALTGLGTGWTAILMLDVIGRRILDPGASVDDNDILENTDEQKDLLSRIDRADRRIAYKRKNSDASSGGGNAQP